MNNIKYETIKNGYVTKEQAIAIASCDRNLKDSLFKKWKKEDKLYLGFISFHSFDVALVEICSQFAWHIKVKSGSWGATKASRIPIIGIKIGYEHWDGEFDEDSNISCIIMCDSGEYYFGDDIDINDIKPADTNKYKEMLKHSSIYH